MRRSIDEAPKRAEDQLLEAGLFLVIVATPLVFTPFSASPFIDPKLWLVLAGVTLTSLSKVRVDREIAIAAGAFVAMVAVATLFSVDRWWSVIGTEWRGMGLLGLGSCAVLITVATGIPEALRARLPAWVFWTGVAISSIGVVGRFVHVGGDTWSLGRYGATTGHRVFAGAFVAAATIAALNVPRRIPTYIGIIALGSGMSVFAVRSAWIGTVVGLTIAHLRTKDRAQLVSLVVPLVLIMSAWAGANAFLPKSGIEYSAAPRFTQLSEGSALERPQAFKAFARASFDDPVTGSGPGTAWKPYLTHVKPHELHVAGRGFGDTHNIFLEFVVTEGFPTFALASILLAFVLWRLRGAPRDRGWAFGCAAALGVVQLLEPLNLIVTSLMFLCAGLAVADAPIERTCLLRRWTILPLIAGLMLSTSDLVSSSLERYGAIYGSETALRMSMSLAPWRELPPLLLANQVAFDYRQGDGRARRRADRLVRDDVAAHSWYPNVRIDAASVEILLNDVSSAAQLYRQQLRLYPNDPNALGGAAQIALRRGRYSEARTLAREALRLDPQLVTAKAALEEAGKHLGK